MSDSWQVEIQALLSQSRVSFLATQGIDGPETSMAPFAMHEGSILLHLSRLAAHTTNIEKSNEIGLMICTPERFGASPLALPRLSLRGQITPVSEEQFEAAKAAYLNCIPDAEQLFTFSDFRLFQLKPTSINWVGGFGKARKISLQQWCRISLTK